MLKKPQTFINLASNFVKHLYLSIAAVLEVKAPANVITNSSTLNGLPSIL